MSAIHRNKTQSLRFTRDLLKLSAGVILVSLALGNVALGETSLADGPTSHAATPGTETLQLARVEAAERVAVMPRVSGHIDAVLFSEGDTMVAGQPLFQIDPRPYALAVDLARADLQLALAHENVASSEVARARGLAIVSAISIEELEKREAAFASACAQRALAEAKLESAELNLEYTLVTAPIAGRIGRALITAGNFVSGQGDLALATIVSSDDLDVHFDISDRGLLAHAQNPGAAPLHVRVVDSATQRELATVPIDFIDNEINAQTGTLRMRARIDGSDTGLLPGQFVLVELSVSEPIAAVGNASADASAKPI